MKFILLILSSVVADQCLSQEIFFAEDGKKTLGYAHTDTVIKLPDKLKTINIPFVFKKIDEGSNQISIENETIHLDLKRVTSDSIERFCLINTGTSPIGLTKQNKSFIAIKEAFTYNNKWLPIEFWIYEGCGLIYSEYSLLPGQILIFYTRKQFGEKSTSIRLRLKTQSNGVILSEPYAGNIDDSYFILNSELEKFTFIIRSRIDYLK